MGYLENGGRYPEILEPPMYKKDENFRTWEQLVLEFEKNFPKDEMSVGTTISVTMDRYGLEVTVNLQGRQRLKYKVRTSPYTVTKYHRLYHSETYIISEKEEKGKGVKKHLLKLLADEEWLQAEKVEEAFRTICQARGWRMGVRPYLCEIEQEDGFKSVALATTAKDKDSKEHQMLCLITNGLVMLDAEAELTPVPQSKNLLRVAGCIFHVEKREKALTLVRAK